jgi:hypothetical protein
MTVSMPFHVARKRMIKVFAFKPFTIYKLSHDRLTKNYIIKATLSVIPAPYRVRGKLQPVSSSVAFKVAGFRVRPGMTVMRLY